MLQKATLNKKKIQRKINKLVRLANKCLKIFYSEDIEIKQKQILESYSYGQNEGRRTRLIFQIINKSNNCSKELECTYLQAGFHYDHFFVLRLLHSVIDS